MAYDQQTANNQLFYTATDSIIVFVYSWFDDLLSLKLFYLLSFIRK